uniref:C2H2-type domain-containing protein n=1 Tax=Malurus cyaneus samueli TaxID=2593467 RepID=A0A8C5TXL0_9PASS
HAPQCSAAHGRGGFPLAWHRPWHFGCPPTPLPHGGVTDALCHPGLGAGHRGWEVLAPQQGKEGDRGSQEPVHPDTAPSALSGRKLSGKAGIDEVMAAAVLTSLSASPLVLGHMPATHGPEPGSEVWKEVPAMSSSCSSSSNTSGDWAGTPPGPDEPDSTHFVFGEPPHGRGRWEEVMFKCLWKSCGKVLSSSSGMQKHIRTVHLGRKADLEQSDGEEDFYYTELDVDVDALTDGLSSLTPVSPTSSVPPAFPGLRLLPHGIADPDLAWPRPPLPSHPTLPSPRVPPVVTCPLYRSGRGGAKKCRKVYGWSTGRCGPACRWKKASAFPRLSGAAPLPFLHILHYEVPTPTTRPDTVAHHDSVLGYHPAEPPARAGGWGWCHPVQGRAMLVELHNPERSCRSLQLRASAAVNH